MDKYQHYINGKWVDSVVKGESIIVNDPATEEAIGEISCAVKDLSLIHISEPTRPY